MLRKASYFFYWYSTQKVLRKGNLNNVFCCGRLKYDDDGAISLEDLGILKIEL